MSSHAARSHDVRPDGTDDWFTLTKAAPVKRLLSEGVHTDQQTDPVLAQKMGLLTIIKKVKRKEKEMRILMV